MGHGLIIGQTGAGKTTKAKQLVEQLKSKNKHVLVYDPEGDSWAADRIFQEGSFQEFLTCCKGSRGCYIFVDEAEETCGEWELEAHWLAKRSRKYGHSVFFMSQFVSDISKKIRRECEFLFLFAVFRSDAELMAKEWNKPELYEAPGLSPGEFFFCSKFGPAERLRIF